jgi:hypothetical protein
MRRAGVARTLAIRTCFGARLHHRLVFGGNQLFILRLPLVGECHNTDDGETEHRKTDAAEHSLLHSSTPFLRFVCSTQMTEICHFDASNRKQQETSMRFTLDTGTVDVRVGLLLNLPAVTSLSDWGGHNRHCISNDETRCF